MDALPPLTPTKVAPSRSPGLGLFTTLLLGATSLLLTAGASRAEELPPDCGTLENPYGPFDYTNPEHFQKKLPIVEKWHFNKEQELATYQANSTRRVDLDYTLRAFPNHHRALMGLARTVRLSPKKEWAVRPECYFIRAVVWRPQDGVSRMIYGLYLHQQQRLRDAEVQYKLAIAAQRDYAEAHYNLGLLYADQKRWPDALASAHRAYALKYPLPGLRNRLLAAAAWQDPPAAPAPAAESPKPATPTTETPVDKVPVAETPAVEKQPVETAPSTTPVTTPATTSPPSSETPVTPVPATSPITDPVPNSATNSAVPTLTRSEDHQ